MVTVIVILISLLLSGCSSSAPSNDVIIEDPARISQYNQMAIDAIDEYFDIEIPENVEFAQQALESYTTVEGIDDSIHFANIFQASRDINKIENGDVYAYGIVLSPDDRTINGVLLSIFDDDLPVIAYTLDELLEIAENFLRKHDFIEDWDTITHIPASELSSESPLSIIQVQSSTHKFAIGISTQYSKVILFERIELT